MNEKELVAIERAKPLKTEEAWLNDYNPEMTAKEFKERYAGLYAKDTGKRLSKSSMQRIWNKFVKEERIDFFKAHTTFTMEDILAIGIDKFIYTMGWTKPAHVRRWRNNKVRVGLCAHCNHQFIPLMFQVNHGLCRECRPLYSVKAMQNFVLKQLHESERYYKAHRDALMDFYIMFYHDPKLRKLFLKESEMAQELEQAAFEIPEWVHARQDDIIEAEFTEVKEDGQES